jgi:hypothetical protein
VINEDERAWLRIFMRANLIGENVQVCCDLLACLPLFLSQNALIHRTRPIVLIDPTAGD